MLDKSKSKAVPPPERCKTLSLLNAAAKQPNPKGKAAEQPHLKLLQNSHSPTPTMPVTVS